MRDYSSISKLPKKPGVYCLQGYSAKGLYNAYVGISNNIQNRISQHLEYRNSSVTTGGSAVSIDSHLVGGCKCWCSPDFENKAVLAAAEITATAILDPVLRSRGGRHGEGSRLAQEEAFVEKIRTLLQHPTADIIFRDFTDLSRTVDRLQQRIDELERQLAGLINIRAALDPQR